MGYGAVVGAVEEEGEDVGYDRFGSFFFEDVDEVVVGAWVVAGGDELAKRAVLLTQLDSLRIRRGVVGRMFDDERVLLWWRN